MAYRKNLLLLFCAQTAAMGWAFFPNAPHAVSPLSFPKTPRTVLKSDISAPIHTPTLTNPPEGANPKKKSRKGATGPAKAVTATAALAGAVWLLKEPFSFAAVPYVACLLWGLPSSMIGSRKSVVSMAHRFGGMATLVLPLILAFYQAITGGLFPPRYLYFFTVATAAANLGFGAALICRRVPGYDIPTLRAFAVGVSLGLAFLGHSLLFVLGSHPWYRPVGVLFCAVAVYSAVFATSDALQHAWNFAFGKRGFPPGRLSSSLKTNKNGGTRFWTLPFERAKLRDVFLFNLWKQPSFEALEATVSPANSVVVFTTGMTALFASLSLLQLRYLVLGPDGMARLLASEPAFCGWSAVQALLAVVANNFGTFAGTLVIQRRTSQKQAGVYNAIGLLIPVVNLVALFALRSPGKTASEISRLMTLPSL